MPAPEQPLIVAVKQAPPFAYRTTDGEWTGQSIELWRAVADELDLRYELHETTLDDMIAGVAEGRYQVAVAALTVTSSASASSTSRTPSTRRGWRSRSPTHANPTGKVCSAPCSRLRSHA